MHHSTLSSDADGRANIVAGDHASWDVSRSERGDRRRCPRLQLVFEDDDAEEAQVGLDGLSTSRGPRQPRNKRFRSTVRLAVSIFELSPRSIPAYSCLQEQ